MLLRQPFFSRFCITKFLSSLSSSMFEIYFYITDILKAISIIRDENERVRLLEGQAARKLIIGKYPCFGGKQNSPSFLITQCTRQQYWRLQSANMDLIFQNSKDLKEVRQFIKSLGYVYDSIDKKEKEVFLFISGSYIAIINNFINVQAPDYKVCFCKLKRNMYKLRNFFPNQQLEAEGIIYYIDSDSILKLLNTQVESDITQMVMTFPSLDATGEKQYEMKLSYEADGLRASFKLFARLEHSSWPFKQGVITESCVQNSTITKFLVFPSRFVKQVEYYKKFNEFWICLNHEGLNIKRTQGGYIVSDQALKGEEFGEYDFYALNEALNGNIFLNINSHDFFHHLEQSNKENRKTQAKIMIDQEYVEEQITLKRCYLCLATCTEKRQIHEFFLIAARKAIDYSGIAREAQRLKLRLKDAKKQEEQEEQRVVLNRFYGPEYEETVRLDMIMREGFSRQAEPRGEEAVVNARKYKIEL